MSEAVIVALINFATKFGIDAALAVAGSLKPGATIDDAIAALERAKTKTAADYLKEAQLASLKAPQFTPLPTPGNVSGTEAVPPATTQ